MQSIQWMKSLNPELSSVTINNFAIVLCLEFKELASITFCDITDHGFTIGLIIVFEPCRGTGTQIMKRITSFCRRTGATCRLIPSSDFGTPYEVLHRFYASHGFKIDRFRPQYLIYNAPEEIYMAVAPSVF